MPHPSGRADPDRPWAFLTTHAHVLLCLAADPAARVREVAARLGLTEGTVKGVVAELRAGGYVTATRDGRRNRYAVHPGRRLRHPLLAHRTVGDLLALARDAAVAGA